MRILRRKALIPKVGYSAATIDRLEAAGLFPRRLKLGANSVGWLESEVEAWIKQRVAKRDAECLAA